MLMTPPPPSYRSPPAMNQQNTPLGGGPGVQNPNLFGNNSLGQEGMPRFDTLGTNATDPSNAQNSSLGQGMIPGMQHMNVPQPSAQSTQMIQALLGQMPPGMGQ